MKNKLIWIIIILSFGHLILNLPIAQAMSSQTYKMEWVDTSTSGQGSAASGDYRVTYSSGQTAIGPSTSENFVLEYGTALTPGKTFVHLPLVVQ